MSDIVRTIRLLLAEERGKTVRAVSAPPTLYATVARIDPDGSAWVRIDGGEGDTPATCGVSCRSGDRVTVVIEGNRARVTGNVSNPPTDDRAAESASRQASQATSDAHVAHMAAEAAQQSADAAQSDAQRALDAADAAQTAAENAQTSADTAASAAAAAQTSADDARNDARRANTSANDALNQLSVVQDVAGTLTWISEHGRYVSTADTEVVAGRVYFALDNGQYVPVVNPTGNPSTHGWYVLDVTDSQADYVMSHLAVTSQGLWVLPSGMGQSQDAQHAPGYKMLLANTGAYLYDGYGHLVTTYGESIIFDSSRPQTIGGRDAYIAFYDSDNDGSPDSIAIAGNVTFSRVDAIDRLVESVAATAKKVDDVPLVTLSSTNGTVFKRNLGVSTTIVATIYTPGGRIDDVATLRQRFGAGAYLEWGWRDVVTDANHVLLVTDPRITQGGFALTVSPEDIDTQAVITCSLCY